MAKQPLKRQEIIEDGALDNLVKSAKAALAVVNQLEKSLKGIGKGLKSSVKAKDLSTATGIKQYNENIKQVETTTKSLIKVEKEKGKVKKVLSDAELAQAQQSRTIAAERKKLLTAELTLANKTAGTLEKLAASSTKLRLERQKLNLETKKGQDRLKAINVQLDKNNAKINKNSDALKKQKINVGNYTNSMRDGIAASGVFGRQLAVLQRVQATLSAFTKKNTAETVANTAATKGAAAASGGFSKALKILKFALISTGIGAIVVVLGSLVAAFSGTQRGADAFTKVLRPLQALFAKFIGFIENTSFAVLDKLKAAFDDPKQAVKDLAKAIKENLIKRFESIAVFGKGIAKLFSGEFKEGFEDLGNASIQLATGVENATGKMKEFADETARAVKESVALALVQGAAVDALQKTFERLEIDSVLPLAKARFEYQKLKELANNQLLTDQERVKALEDAEKVLRFISGTEVKLLNLKIQRVELEQSFNDTSRVEELELARLKEQRFISETTAQKKISGLVSLRTGIELRSVKAAEAKTKAVEGELKAAAELAKLEKGNTAEAETQNKLAGEKREVELGEFASREDELADKKRLAEAEIALITAVADKAKEASKERQADIEKDISAAEKRQDALRRLAAEGNLDAEQSLAIEEKRRAELELARQKEVKRQEQIEFGLAALNTFSSLSQGGAEPISALAQTAAAMAGLTALIQAFPGFYEGAENVGEGNTKKIHGGRDGFLAKLDGNERVFTSDQNAKIGDISNEDAAGVLAAHQKGLFLPQSMAFPVGVPVQSAQAWQSNQAIIGKFDELKNSIENIPHDSYHYDELERAVVHQIENKNKTLRNHYKQKCL